MNDMPSDPISGLSGPATPAPERRAAINPVDMPAQDLSAKPRTYRNLTPAATRRSAGSTTILALICCATAIATAIFVYGLSRAFATERRHDLSLHLPCERVAAVCLDRIRRGQFLGGCDCHHDQARPRHDLAPPADTPIATRTALLFPVYHEAPAAIAERIAELDSELIGLGIHDHFDAFILSDSQRPEARLEESAFFRH
ncbi:MAG: hypothetical protein R3D43_10090 [Tepidamorphaceae bacterium]